MSKIGTIKFGNNLIERREESRSSRIITQKKQIVGQRVCFQSTMQYHTVQGKWKVSDPLTDLGINKYKSDIPWN